MLNQNQSYQCEILQYRHRSHNTFTAMRRTGGRVGDVLGKGLLRPKHDDVLTQLAQEAMAYTLDAPDVIPTGGWAGAAIEATYRPGAEPAMLGPFALKPTLGRLPTRSAK